MVGFDWQSTTSYQCSEVNLGPGGTVVELQAVTFSRTVIINKQKKKKETEKKKKKKCREVVKH